MTGKKSPFNPFKGKSPTASGVHGNDPERRQACIDLAGGDERMSFLDGHDDAIIGVADRDGEDVAVYDIKKIVRRLRQRDGMSKEDAEEFFAYNISNTCIGAGTPIFVEFVNG